LQGDLVYVYYGREEDYAELTEAGIDVAGKIILARYGAVFRANIVRFGIN
jgi:N-acetylated-alpha-linked acidic dipeptidase